MPKPGSEYLHEFTVPGDGDDLIPVVWAFEVPDFLDVEVGRIRARMRWLYNAWNNSELDKRYTPPRKAFAAQRLAMFNWAVEAEAAQKAGEDPPEKPELPEIPEVDTSGIEPSEFALLDEFETAYLAETIDLLRSVSVAGENVAGVDDYKADLRNDTALHRELMTVRAALFLWGGRAANAGG